MLFKTQYGWKLNWNFAFGLGEHNYAILCILIRINKFCGEDAI